MPPEFRKNLSKKKQKRKIFGVDPADLPLELDGGTYIYSYTTRTARAPTILLFRN